MALVSGTRLGPYEIGAQIGAGGMGEVYRARDTRLGRDVAIKVLPAVFAADPDRLRRFEHEARAIAALNHPHICQIHDVGQGYLVLEYVEGEPLHGPMAVDQAVRLALQIASALEAAHQRGILHRDLKPANVLVTGSSGSSDPPRAKLLDFGIAKLMGALEGEAEDLTRTIEGAVVGTAAYMSPEQAEGKALDARSDIFSFGAVLYEMLSGTRAFAGHTSAQVVSAVMRDDPPQLQTPAALDGIVRRCLQKASEQRFQAMADVKTALEQLSAKPADPRRSIAVLSFADMSAGRDHEWFSDGLAEEIINALTRIPDLKVIARTSAFAFKGRQEDIRRIAEALGVAHVLEGSVRKAGTRVRVTAQLITAADGSHLWSERYDREMVDVFALQDEISHAIAGALQVALVGQPGPARHTPKMPAYEAVLKGRHHMLRHTPSSFARANDCFEQAISIDPLYAKPHANLGSSYLFSAMLGLRSLREAMPLIRAEANEALALDPSDPSPHSLLASVAAAYEYDWKAAAEHFAMALAGASVSSDAHWAYASLYLQPLGRFNEAVSHMEHAVERDPVNAHWRGVLASHLTHARRYEEAIRQAKEALEIDESSLAPPVTLGEAFISLGRWEEAAAVLEKSHRLHPQEAMSTGMLAGALVQMGQQERANGLMRDLGEAPRPLMGRVLYHLACSEMDQAADWYERAINARDPFALVFANVPFADAFRASARWPKLARMMNLPDAAV
jgi:eukaryotic-like serine/threonine-protein kinase